MGPVDQHYDDVRGQAHHMALVLDSYEVQPEYRLGKAKLH
jgi:hypothetical protein